MECLRKARWEGNVRELRNLIESLVVLVPDDEIEVAHLPDEIQRAALEQVSVTDSPRPGAPQGAFYLLPRFADACPRFAREGRPATAAELCRRILDDTGVALLPGNDFGMPEGELFVRLAAVDFDGAAALSAFDGLGVAEIPDEEFLHARCRTTMTGIDRVCEWLADNG